jgi:hypothetical protein
VSPDEAHRASRHYAAARQHLPEDLRFLTAAMAAAAGGIGLQLAFDGRRRTVGREELQMRNLTIIVLVLVGFLSFEPSASAFHPNYGGGHHSGSHGGHYPGGSGSSHKGGKYKNPKTDNQYGRHEK